MIIAAAAVIAAPPMKTYTAKTVVAVAEGSAVILWNAGDLVLALKQQRMAPDAALREIEAGAASILHDKMAILPRATSLTIHVFYPHEPEFNPAYKALVMNSIERLVNLTASTSDIKTRGKGWPAEILRGNPTPGLQIAVTGKLPPF